LELELKEMRHAEKHEQQREFLSEVIGTQFTANKSKKKLFTLAKKMMRQQKAEARKSL
jgi:hypothetical protein